MYVLGLMSGTSADGVDAALVDFQGNFDKPKWNLINSASIAYSSSLQKKIIDIEQGMKVSASEWSALSEEITEIYSTAARTCDPTGLAKIAGCHGQTVFYRPPEKPLLRGSSWQLIQGPLLAVLLERTVIYDFRAKDLALGGQGAPLSPLLDSALIGGGAGWRAVLNLGGIANLSLIPPLRGPDRHLDVMGWDCGPANSLIDLAVNKVTNGQLNFDCDGLLASKGVPDLKVIDDWLQEDFFQLLPPKSTGREFFGLEDLEQRFSEVNSDNANDLIATMTCFTASIVAQDLEILYRHLGIKPVELFVAGGGSKNKFLMEEIQTRCMGVQVLTTDAVGIPVQIRESIGFALLAWWNICKKPYSHSITNAERPSVLGVEVNYE